MKEIELDNKRKLIVEGCSIHILLAGKKTNNKLSLIEHTMPGRYKGPKKHLHKTFDQYCYVLEGEPTFVVGNDVIETKIGSFITLPKNIPHEVYNNKLQMAKFLTLMTPAGFENFFIELEKLEKNNNLDLPDNKDKVKVLAEKYDEFFTWP